MPAYKHQFTNVADVETAYAEAVTVKTAFAVPYGDDIKPGREAFNAYLKAKVLPDALKVAKQMKNKDLIAKVEAGTIPEVVALAAYLDRLK
jgi:cytochrome c oxidase cbb3-type subunit 2